MPTAFARSNDKIHHRDKLCHWAFSTKAERAIGKLMGRRLPPPRAPAIVTSAKRLTATQNSANTMHDLSGSFASVRVCPPSGHCGHEFLRQGHDGPIPIIVCCR